MTPPDLTSFFSIFRSYFVPAYKDMTGRCQQDSLLPANLPEAIVISLDGLCRSCSNATDPESSAHLLIAKNNLTNATFACYAISLRIIDGEILYICKDSDIREKCIHIDYSEFEEMYQDFNSLVLEASRKRRIYSNRTQTEKSFMTAIDAYKAAIGQGEELQRNVDWEKGKRLYGFK